MITYPKEVHEKLAMLPDKPGVYMMRDRRGKVIYIGKATSLKSRVRHYFQDATFRHADPKTRGLLRSIANLDFVVLKSEAEAAVTESQLIKDFKPRYNIMLKDDKRFLLLKIDIHHPYPKIQTCRLQKNDGAVYFGPYANSAAARSACEFVEQQFGLKQCDPLRPDQQTYKHCLNDIIRYCSAPCVQKITDEEYREKVEEACAFLRGERPKYLKELHDLMITAAQNLEFERAAAIRDHYLLLKKSFKEKAKVQKGLLIKQQEAMSGLQQIQAALHLECIPTVIETFDISNISGTLAVASMVVAVDGLPDRKRYRRFRIKTIEGSNDPAMMGEVVQRRYARLLSENADLPGLVLVDGGLTQVASARAILDSLGLYDLPVAGIAKKYEELYSDSGQDPVRFPSDADALKVLTQIRDEAHRFAITYHRNVRAKKIRESELDDIPGIGDKRKQQLLEHFGSVSRLRKATEKEISDVSGFGDSSARVVREALGEYTTRKPK